jgi:cystathionine beta-lyase/cystathionine gamma-synthase
MNTTNLNAPKEELRMKPATKFIHAGAHPDASTGAIMTPIYQTSTYVQEAPGVNKGFEYARSQNPTRKALEEALAVIENGKFGLAFSSGVPMICMVALIVCLPKYLKNLESFLSMLIQQMLLMFQMLLQKKQNWFGWKHLPIP